MRKLSVAVVIGWMVCGVAFADQVDEAEAKKRGVPVEVVQLENAQARIKALEKENAELKAKLVAATKPATTKSSAVATAKAAPTPEVKVGMKREDVPKEYVTISTSESAGRKNETMEWTIYSFGGHVVKRINLVNGVVESVQSNAYPD